MQKIKLNKLILVITLLGTTLLHAQEPGVRIIREGVRFMAVIKEKSNADSVFSLTTLESLVNYSRVNKIEGLDEFIEKWAGSDMFTNDLSALAAKVIDDLTGGESKAVRKTKFESAFTNFSVNVANIAATETGDIKEVEKKQQEPPKKETEIRETKIPPAVTADNTWSYAAIAAAAIAFLTALVALAKNKSVDKKLKSHYENAMERQSAKLKELKLELESEIHRLKSDIKAASPLSSKTTQPLIAVKDEPVAEKPAPQLPETIIKYAKNPVVDSFEAVDLKSRQNNECIFELHITGNQAVIKISDDPKAQAYALGANPEYYFKPGVCDMEGTPAAGKLIITLNPGAAVLNESDNQWIVTQKLKLVFR